MSDPDPFPIQTGMLLPEEAQLLTAASRGESPLDVDSREMIGAANGERNFQETQQIAYLSHEFMEGTQPPFCGGNDTGPDVHRVVILIVNHLEQSLVLTESVDDKHGDLVGAIKGSAVPAKREGCPGLGIMVFDKLDKDPIFSTEQWYGIHVGFAFQPTPLLPQGVCMSALIHYKRGEGALIQILPSTDYKQAMKDTSNSDHEAAEQVSRVLKIRELDKDVTTRLSGCLHQPGVRREYLIVFSVERETA